MHRLFFIGLLLAAETAAAQVNPRVTRVAAPRDAVAHATQDILRVPKADQPFVRYIWSPDPSPPHTAAVAYTLNAVLSQSAELYYPDVLHGGAMIRFDIRRLAPRETDFSRLRDLWEDLAAFEPYFHTNRSVVKEISAPVISEPKKKLVRVDPYVVNGKVYNAKWVDDVETTTKTSTQQVLVSEFSIHTGLENTLLLHSLTGSKVPIVRSDWFVLKAWTPIDGFYYKFIGVEKEDGKFISLNDWLLDAGADEQDFKKWKADQKPADERAATFRSRITDKPRGMAVFNGKSIRPSFGSPVIAITEDIKRGNFDPKAHPIQTLVAPKFDGHEAIKRRRNGTIEFLVADKDGNVLPSVPEDIAVDRTIPGPGPVQLEAGMSCLACHGGQDGYLPFQNDVQKLFTTYLQVFDDENSEDNFPETLEVVSGKYGGDMDTVLMTLRRDTQRTANLATRGQSFATTAAAIVACRDRFLYDAITPRIAARDLGYAVASEAEGQVLFPMLVPILPVNSANVSPEDPFVAALRGYSIDKWPVRLRREDWERIYADVALRAITEESNRSKNGSKQK